MQPECTSFYCCCISAACQVLDWRLPVDYKLWGLLLRAYCRGRAARKTYSMLKVVVVVVVVVLCAVCRLLEFCTDTETLAGGCSKWSAQSWLATPKIHGGADFWVLSRNGTQLDFDCPYRLNAAMRRPCRPYHITNYTNGKGEIS